jgi:hypothetical protein
MRQFPIGREHIFSGRASRFCLAHSLGYRCGHDERAQYEYCNAIHGRSFSRLLAVSVLNCVPFKELEPLPQFRATAKLGEFLETKFSQSFLALWRCRPDRRSVTPPTNTSETIP